MLVLGSVRIGSPAVQAALSGYSDLPMRRVARAHGAAYALNEVVLDELVLTRGKAQRRILEVAADDHPVGGQLMGSRPEAFGAAADMLVRAGYDVVDINFGCPVRKALGRCRGGWLLSEPAVALEIVERVLDAVGGRTPVTVKMRRGFDDSAASEHAFWEILEGAFARGIDAVTVHGRTVRQKYVGPSRWSFLRAVKQRFPGRTVLGSGDLFGAADAVRMLAETGVDGVTMARGCIGNPFVFAQVEALLAGRPPRVPALNDFGCALRMHAREAAAFYGAERAVGKIRLHAIQYARHHPEPERARDAMVAIRRLEDVEAAVGEWFDGRSADPAERAFSRDGRPESGEKSSDAASRPGSARCLASASGAGGGGGDRPKAAGRSAADR